MDSFSYLKVYMYSYYNLEILDKEIFITFFLKFNDSNLIMNKLQKLLNIATMLL